jgi:hypothetical protein
VIALRAGISRAAQDDWIPDVTRRLVPLDSASTLLRASQR